MTNLNKNEMSDSELDDFIDNTADKIATSLTNQLIKWFVRTLIGLILFGILWHYYDWGIWVFGGYIILATLSLLTILYLHNKVIEKIANIGDDI